MVHNEIRRLHANDRAHVVYHNAMTALYLGLMVASAWTWAKGWWPLTIVCWGVAGHVGHAKLIAFHEAAHGTLNARPWLNELQGVAIGTVILVPLSVYRYVHGRHHAQLASKWDLELWPFVDTARPKWQRRLAAAAELLVGYFYTPILFAHGVWVGDDLKPRQRRRIAEEYALCALVWAVTLTIVARNGWWTYFVVGYLVPAMLAGNLQSLRKFTEHLGLVGGSIVSTTRTVIDRHPLGSAMSRLLLHIDYHGTHHRYARLPYYNLPAATPYVLDTDESRQLVFPTYAAAMRDMFPALKDPKVGKQWEDNIL
jgi:fatty acid desaturase